MQIKLISNISYQEKYPELSNIVSYARQYNFYSTCAAFNDILLQKSG